MPCWPPGPWERLPWLPRSLGAPAGVLAADGEAIKIGQANDGSSVTQLAITGSPVSALEVLGDGGQTGAKLGGKWLGVHGFCGEAGATAVNAWAGHAGGTAIHAVNDVNLTETTLGTSAGVWTKAPSNLLALMVEGRTAFSRSGVLTVARGSSSATKTGLAPLTAKSYVLATLQQYRSGLYVAAAVPNARAGSITIYLNKAATAATKVAWFIIESI